MYHAVIVMNLAIAAYAFTKILKLERKERRNVDLIAIVYGVRRRGWWESNQSVRARCRRNVGLSRSFRKGWDP
jgi:hypothetical protein